MYKKNWPKFNTYSHYDQICHIYHVMMIFFFVFYEHDLNLIFFFESSIFFADFSHFTFFAFSILVVSSVETLIRNNYLFIVLGSVDKLKLVSMHMYFSILYSKEGGGGGEG